MPVPYDNSGMKFCKHCKRMMEGGCISSLFGCYCPILPEKYELIEAAEFEARVAIKVAQLLRSEDRRLRYILDAAASATPINRGPETTFEWEVIKEARLAVEMEMDQ